MSTFLDSVRVFTTVFCNLCTNTRKANVIASLQLSKDDGMQEAKKLLLVQHLSPATSQIGSLSGSKLEILSTSNARTLKVHSSRKDVPGYSSFLFQ